MIETIHLFCFNSKLMFVSICLIILPLLLFSWFQNRKKELRLFEDLGIPYIKPHIMYGSLHLLSHSSEENELQVLSNWIRQKGKVFGYYVGCKPYLVVSDLDMVKEILIRKSANYTNRPKLAIQAYPVVNTLVGLRDNRWKEVRNMLSPAFSAAKLKPTLHIMNEKVNILLSLLEKANRMDEKIEWLSMYQGLTLDIISSCAFAMNTNCLQKQNNDPFFAAVRDFLLKAKNSAVLWAQYLPSIAFLMTVINNYWSKSGKATQMTIANLKTAITLRRNNPSERRRDILQTILDSSNEDNVEHLKGKLKQPSPLTDEEIISNSWVFLLGGYETTAAALSFTTYLLAKHPDVQQKVYQEITDNINFTDNEDHISYEDILNLPYLDQVFNESLRLYPPVSSFMQREALDDDEIHGYKIPKDTNIVIPVWEIHHSSEHWVDPFKFDPERFSSKAKSSRNRHPMAFIPFGSGPRNCIGMRFGQVASKLTLVRVLLRYRFECCDETPGDLRLKVPTVTLLPKEKIFLKVVKRKTEC